MDEQKTYYKVCRRSVYSRTYISAISGVMEYRVGETTVRRPSHGPLCVFESRETAERTALFFLPINTVLADVVTIKGEVLLSVNEPAP